MNAWNCITWLVCACQCTWRDWERWQRRLSKVVERLINAWNCILWLVCACRCIRRSSLLRLIVFFSWIDFFSNCEIESDEKDDFRDILTRVKRKMTFETSWCLINLLKCTICLRLYVIYLHQKEQNITIFLC